MTTLLDIGTSLVKRRRALGLSQRELAERVGVAQPQVARWESTAYRTVTLERVSTVAEALDFAIGTEASLAAEEAAAYTAGIPGAGPEALRSLSRTGARPEAVAAFARSHGIGRLDLFGSVLTPRFGPTSDVDILFSCDPDAVPSIIELADWETELSAILHRRVDLVSRAGLQRSPEAGRRRQILESAKPLYERP